MPDTAYAAFGILTFEGVVGQVVPNATKVVLPVENPAQVKAAERRVGQWHQSSLFFNGWFSASQSAALYATVGTVLSCHDETGALFSVLVVSVNPQEQVCANNGTVGVWVECTAIVEDWPA